MQQIIYLDKEQEKSADSNYSDIVQFNSVMKGIETANLKSFQVDSKGKNVNIDLTNGDIVVDGESVDLKLDAITKSQLNIENLRWVNFHRKRVSFGMTGRQETESVAYGIGWQATIGLKNVKRYVLVTNEGFELKTE